MIPRPQYPTDAHTQAQGLVSEIASAASAAQIAAACSAVDDFLLRHSAEHPRAFFGLAFPSLLSRLFGFHDASSPSWLDSAAADPALADRVLSLLSPSGALLSAVAAADRQSLLRYVFPTERLPEWMRCLLKSSTNRPLDALSQLCPLLQSRLKEDPLQSSLHLHLNIFEYYVFWFAYYPVSRGNMGSSDPGTKGKNLRFRLENWTSSLPVLAGASRQAGQKQATINIYSRLLHTYLQAFVPNHGLGSIQPYRSSLLHYSPTSDGLAFEQARFFMHSLVHFWMVDNDFSPLPVTACRSLGIAFPFHAVLGVAPPTAGLGEALKLVVRYLNSALVASVDGEHPKVGNGSTQLKATDSLSLDFDKSANALMCFETWNLVMQRPLYRFVLRTFLFCPMGTSIKNAHQVLSLWVEYMAPWRTTPNDCAEFNAPLKGSKDAIMRSTGHEAMRPEAMYTRAWQGYVLKNFLFYSSLMVHFLGFAHKFLHRNSEAVIEMVAKVLNVLTSSTELVDLLHKADAAHHSKMVGPSTHDNIYKYVVSIREQLQDWEDGLCECDADGSFLHDKWNNDLKLFSDGEEGAQNLLRLFVLRGEHELQTIPGDITGSLQALDYIRAQINILFDSHISITDSPISSERSHDVQGREMFTPKHPGVGKRTWADVEYKGDLMRRPFSENEVAWLAKCLIHLSDWLNEFLGLDRYHVAETSESEPIYLDLSHTEMNNLGGPKEAAYLFLSQICFWLGLFGQMVLRFMRSRGLRINMRMLASKKIMFALFVYATFHVLRCLFPFR